MNILRSAWISRCVPWMQPNAYDGYDIMKTCYPDPKAVGHVQSWLSGTELSGSSCAWSCDGKGGVTCGGAYTASSTLSRIRFFCGGGEEKIVEPASYPGEYTVEVIGQGISEYKIAASLSDGQRNRDGFFEFAGVIDAGQVRTIKFTYSIDPAQPVVIAKKAATPLTLKEEIKGARKMKWIKNDGIETSFLQKAEAIEATISRGNKTAAKNQIEALINEVQAYVKTLPPSEYKKKQGYDQHGNLVESSFIGNILERMLIQDAEAIRDGL